MKNFLLLFLCLVPLVFCEYVKIPITSCGAGYEDLPCEIHEVLVDECDIDRQFCELQRLVTYQMDMKFTPDFEGSNIKLLASTNIKGKDISFDGMDPNACIYMKCPIEKGVQQSYVFNVTIGASRPKGTFKTRWLMEQDGEKRCCFMNTFKIV